jgi:hypothetical protein
MSGCQCVAHERGSLLCHSGGTTSIRSTRPQSQARRLEAVVDELERDIRSQVIVSRPSKTYTSSVIWFSSCSPMDSSDYPAVK